MKRYVRLKTNEIVDTEHEEVDKYLFKRILGNSFIAESNSILDLIQIGDLVQTDFYMIIILNSQENNYESI